MTASTIGNVFFFGLKWCVIWSPRSISIPPPLSAENSFECCPPQSVSMRPLKPQRSRRTPVWRYLFSEAQRPSILLYEVITQSTPADCTAARNAGR